MVLLSSRKLEQVLADGKLETWSKVKYLILPAVLNSLAAAFYIRPWYGPKEPALNIFVSVPCNILTAYLTFWGIKRAFLENQKIDGVAFFERFAMLCVPPMIRVMTVTFLLSLAVAYSRIPVPEEGSLVFTRASIFFSVLGPILTFAVYSMVRRSFQRLGELIRQRNH